MFRKLTPLLTILTLCTVVMSSPVIAKNSDGKVDDTKLYPVLDSANTSDLPKNFRTSNDPFKQNVASLPSRQGMEKLNISGSGEFSAKGLQAMQSKIGKKKVIVVDLREESHLFVNGMPVTWYATYDWGNLGKDDDAIHADEKKRKAELGKSGNTTLVKVIKKGPDGTIGEIEPVAVKISNVETEKDIVKALGYDYFRVTCTDHRRPVDEDVDRFIKFTRKLDDDTWLHFHCRAGVGRTTTFMAMYDMMRNAKKVSLEDIANRQILIGGKDLLTVDTDDKVKEKYAKERVAFIKKFYEYCRTNKDDFKTSWSEWSRKH